MLAVVRLCAAGIASSAMIACVAPGSAEAPLPEPLLATGGCEGDAPACVTGCSARAYLGRAACAGGIWHCEAGVRHDLCCDPYHPEQCPQWGEECGPDAACGAGYTCVASRSWPLPADEGVCRLGDWTIPEPLETCSGDDVLVPHTLFDLGPAAVKLDGAVQVDTTCDDRKCDADNPCCQRCQGSYSLALAEAGRAPVAIALRTETLSCAGTNCGFTCSPLQPGRRYRVWGMWVPDDSGATNGELYVAGSCAE